MNASGPNLPRERGTIDRFNGRRLEEYSAIPRAGYIGGKRAARELENVCSRKSLVVVVLSFSRLFPTGSVLATLQDPHPTVYETFRDQTRRSRIALAIASVFECTSSFR